MFHEVHRTIVSWDTRWRRRNCLTSMTKKICWPSVGDRDGNRRGRVCRIATDRLEVERWCTGGAVRPDCGDEHGGRSSRGRNARDDVV